MRKNFLFLLFLCFGLASCEVRVSDNGDFDGLWQLTSIDSTSVGRVVDMRSSGEFWAVQVHLLEVRNSKGMHKRVLFRFTFQNDSLLLRSPYFDESGEGGELPEHDVNPLKPYGIDCSDQSFRIHTLNSDRMILEKENVKLYFRKY